MCDDLQHPDSWGGPKANLSRRNDSWYRFTHGFVGEMPPCFSNEPNEHVVQITEDMRKGKPDGYLLHILEPYAQGCWVGISNNGWLANLQEDVKSIPKKLADRLDRWLKENEALFSTDLVANTAILYDHYVTWGKETFDGTPKGQPEFPPKDRSAHRNFKKLGELLCREHQLYRVEVVCEHASLTSERLARYRNLILPDCYLMPESDCQVVQTWIDARGNALVIGQVPRTLAGAEKAASWEEPTVLAWVRAYNREFLVEGSKDVGVALHKIPGGYALHLVNYNMNHITKCVDRIDDMTFTLSFEAKPDAVISFPEEGVQAISEGRTLTVKNIGLYTIVRLTPE